MQKDSKISIKNIANVDSDNIIKILSNINSVKISIFSFGNGPIYGAKHFLGRVLTEYSADKNKRSYAMHGALTIY